MKVFTLLKTILEIYVEAGGYNKLYSARSEVRAKMFSLNDAIALFALHTLSEAYQM